MVWAVPQRACGLTTPASGIQRWFAACPKGIELLLADELRALGAEDAREALAGVHCRGDIAFAYRTLLWSRLASRLMMPLAEFDVPGEQELYDAVRAIDWREHLRPDETFAVAVHGTTRALTNSMFAALRVKDAIVDRLRVFLEANDWRRAAWPAVAVTPSCRTVGMQT